VDEALLAEIRAHDAAVARLGLDIWIGSEPTFTDGSSQEPWWLGLAEGGDKEARARDLLLALAPRLRSPARLLRARGRVYPGESRARFCMGALFRRERWSRAARGAGGRPSLPAFANSHSAGACPPQSSGDAGARPPPNRCSAGACPPLSDGPGPGGIDASALLGDGVDPPAPAEDEAWLTVTPDPGVVEVNMAPAHDLATFAGWCESVYAAAADVGLAPLRFRYNGEVTDSGGGGQITLGGPSPRESPFFARPQLLPRLVRYANRHPALSYAFAPDCVGSASQGPRADEGVRERFEELPVALDRLAQRGERATPEELWGALAPLLVDSSGNSHRAEINVEKLWNPWMEPGGRGKLGVVELRSLRMPSSAAELAALGALYRALAARLAVAPYEEPLVDWGGSLHELFGLPVFLSRDLEEVLADLEEHGLGLGPALRSELLRPPEPLARLALDGATLDVTPARAFWPLLGDVASQERSGARLVDSSSARLQLVVTVPPGEPPGEVAACGWRAPLQPVAGDPRRFVTSVLYRAFTPNPGLHPGLPAIDPLVLTWRRCGRGLTLALHGWRPDGGAYDGLPVDAGEARRRRLERAVISAAPPGEGRPAGGAAFTLDLRRAAPPVPPSPDPTSLSSGGGQAPAPSCSNEHGHAQQPL
jgi:uncharacterized protein (DUF2126 family)